MRKKFAGRACILLLAVVLGAGLFAGCKDKDNGNNNVNNVTSTPEPPVASAEAYTFEPAPTIPANAGISGVIFENSEFKVTAAQLPSSYADYGSVVKDGLLRAVNINYQVGYVDKTGVEIIPLEDRSVRADANDFSEGLACYSKIDDNRDRVYGYINTKGETVIEPQYFAARDFSEGLAAVKQGGEWTGVWGYIDKNGNEVIPFEFSNAGSFYGDYAAVEKDNLWGVINTSGELVIPCAYLLGMGDSTVNIFRDGLAVVWDSTGYKGMVINTGGETIVEFDGLRGNITANYGYGIIEIVKKVKQDVYEYTYYDYNGNKIEDPAYSVYREPIFGKRISMFDFSEGLAVYFFVDDDHNTGYGVVDLDGNEIVPPIYGQISAFSEGLAIADLDGEIYLIDSMGNAVKTGLRGRGYSEGFHGGFAIVDIYGENVPYSVYILEKIPH